MANGRLWTAEEEDYLEKWAGEKSLRLISKHLGRTEMACKQKVSRMGMTTKSATEYLTTYAAAGVLDCSPRTIQRLIVIGRLKAKRFKGGSGTMGTRYLIHIDDLEKVKETRPTTMLGSGNHRAILTEKKVAAMREERRKVGTTYAEFGKRYGVTKAAARRAVCGEAWKHVKDWWEPQIGQNH